MYELEFWFVKFSLICPETKVCCNRKNIVFGKLVHGYEVLKKIEDAGDEEGRPAVTVKIVNSGEYSERGKNFTSFSVIQAEVI